MITVYQEKDFFTKKKFSFPKNCGSFFSIESAEKNLGWFFINEYCYISKF